jgi:hypothetical protein
MAATKPIPVVIVGAKPPSTDDLGRQIVVGVIAMLIVHALVNGGKKRRR